MLALKRFLCVSLLLRYVCVNLLKPACIQLQVLVCNVMHLWCCTMDIEAEYLSGVR